MSKTATKTYEVTIQRTSTYDAVIEVEAGSEEEAETLAMEQVEQGQHDSTFDDNLQDENWEVTETNCSSDD